MKTIIMDPVLGEVNISDGSLCGSLSIKGGGSVVRPSSSTPLSMRLLNVDLSVPSDEWFSLNIDNVTIMNFGDSLVEGGAVRLNNIKSSITSSITNVIFRNNSGRMEVLWLSVAARLLCWEVTCLREILLEEMLEDSLLTLIVRISISLTVHLITTQLWEKLIVSQVLQD